LANLAALFGIGHAPKDQSNRKNSPSVFTEGRATLSPGERITAVHVTAFDPPRCRLSGHRLCSEP